MPTPLTAAWVQAHLPPRPASAHKGHFGTLQILAGSRRYRGAAALAAHGALCAGAGIVQLAAIEPVCAATAARLPACTFLPLAENPAGGVTADALPALLAETPTAILAGCGMGNTPHTATLINGLLAQSTAPIVLDADALNALAAAQKAPPAPDADAPNAPAGQSPLPVPAAPPPPGGNPNQAQSPATHADADLQGAQATMSLSPVGGGTPAALFPPLPAGRGEIILTPHIGEMARLCGHSTAHILQNQPAVAAAFARQHGCTVVLKSHITVVAAPSGALLVNNTAGNPGLAKGGSGDVLAGIIAGLLAQGLPAPTAAGCGVWLHAAAADAAAAETGQTALSPADLPHHLGKVLLALGH